MQASPPRWRHWWLPLSWLLVLVGLARCSLAPPPPLPADAPAASFSADRAIATLDTVLGGVGPHPTGTPQAAEVRRRIEAELTSLGYAPRVQADTVCNGLTCATVHNVLARHVGTDTDAPWVLVSSHYDSVPASPGYADDGSGVAAALELARLLKHHSPRAGVLFLFNEGEETNLLGALAFVRDPAAAEVGSVVNLEARGVRGRALLFETSGPSGPVTGAYARHARHPALSSLYVEIYRLLPNGTDLGIYANRGIPGANFAFVEGGGLYHTALDDREHLDLGTVQHMGEQALAAVLGFADAGDLRAGGDVVVFDALGLFVVGWPATATWWGVIPLTLWFLAVGVGLVIRGKAEPLPTAVAMLATPVAVALTLIVAAVAEATLISLGASWHAVSWPFRLAMWCTALAGVSLVGSELGKWAGPAAICVGAGSVLAGLALASTALLPGGSYLAIAPLLTLTAGMTVAVSSSDERSVLWGAALAPVGGIFLVVLALGLETALGPGALVIAAPAVLGLLPVAPLLAGAPMGRITGGLLGLAILSAGIAAVVPTRSPDAPDALELTHVQHEGRAWWHAANLTWPRGGAMPASWPTFDTATPREAPVQLGGVGAPAEPWDAPDPVLVVTERTARRAQLRLSSVRGGHRVGIVLPAGVRRLAFEGARVPRTSGVAWFYGDTRRGVTVELETTGDLPARLRVLDMAMGDPAGGLPWPDDTTPIHDGQSTVRIVDVPLDPTSP